MDESFQVARNRLEAKGIKFVRLLWCDTANIIRTKAFHVDRFDQGGMRSIDLAAASYGFTALSDIVVPSTGLQPVGSVFLKPDWDTLTFLPYAPFHACVMSHVVTQSGPSALDGRALLQRMIARLYGFYGIRLQIALRNEFYLLDTMHEEIISADDTSYASAEALNIHHGFIDVFSDNLIAQGMTVQHLQAKSGPGQIEIATGYSDPLTAADQQILLRETARATARQHGHIASFLPKIFPDTPGSGTFIQFSLWEEDLNVTGADNETKLTQTAEYFMAGILLHLRALMAMTTPTPSGCILSLTAF